jgi:histidine triad (HIT) family protein
MAFSREQIKEIKKQIINQINSTFPEDKKAESISNIEAMNDSEIIEFLEKNNLIRDEQGNPVESGNCIFCSIINEEIPSTKIFENEDAIAVLELNPLSEGHTLVIPKKHADEISSKIEEFAKEIKSKLKEVFNPRDIIVEHGNLFGHAVINIIPVFTDEIETERKKATPEQLKKTKEKIISKTEKKEIKTKAETHEENKAIEKINLKTKLPRRIP